MVCSLSSVIRVQLSVAALDQHLLLKEHSFGNLACWRPQAIHQGETPFDMDLSEGFVSFSDLTVQRSLFVWPAS
jgi:hypothetical protein